MRRIWLAGLAVTIVGLGVGSRGSVTAQQPDPLIGKWTANLAKSKFDPGPPSFKSSTRSIIDRGNEWLLVDQQGVNPDGTRGFSAGAMKPDGYDYPLAVNGATGLLTAALKRPDRYTFDYTLKVDGKLINSVHAVVSKDGKSFTETGKGTDPQGKPFTNTVVWEKQ